MLRRRFFSRESLQTLSARRCAALDVAAMKETEGYEHYEARRKEHDKQLSSRVLMDGATGRTLMIKQNGRGMSQCI